MYNYQTFLRENKLKEKCQKIRQQTHDCHRQRERKKQTMVQSHKKRIQAFILAMVEKPIKIHQYHQSLYKPRQFDKNKAFVQSALYHNHHTQKSRVQEQYNKNLEFDDIPFKNASNHKFRQFFDEENIKPLKYTPFNSSLRVKQSLERSALNYLDINQNKKLEIAIRANCNKWNNKSLNKMVNKTLFPNLHRRTHFTSLKSIYSQSPCGFLKLKYSQKGKQNLINNLYDQQLNVPTYKQIQKNTNDHTNRRQNTKQALIKCGILKPINTHILNTTQ